LFSGNLFDFPADLRQTAGFISERRCLETIYLTERLPLVFKAAKRLAALSGSRSIWACAVLVPTTGAGGACVMRSESCQRSGRVCWLR
jgi:hypothetical protein